MKAPARLPASLGIAAMQAINVAAIRPSFMTLLFGTGLGCLALAALAASSWGEPGGAHRLRAGSSYMIGTVLVTVASNVPLNESWRRSRPRAR